MSGSICKDPSSTHCRHVTARLRQCCAGGLTSLPVQLSAVSAQCYRAIHRRPTTLRPYYRHTSQFPLVESPGACSVQDSWRHSSIVHLTVLLLATWLQICAVCLTRRPGDVCDHHSLISSMSASRSVHCWRPIVSCGWCSIIKQSAT